MVQTEVLWSEKAHGKGDNVRCVHDLAFSPSGDKMVVAVGFRLLVFSVETGELLTSLKGHESPIYSVAYSRTANASRLATRVVSLLSGIPIVKVYFSIHTTMRFNSSPTILSRSSSRLLRALTLVFGRLSKRRFRRSR